MRSGVGWTAVLSCEFGLVFALLALSGPGRIDIVDGQTRYEAARGLADHGDLVIRDPNVWFGVFPGRGGQPHTTYRFPQTLLGTLAIGLADATGPVCEGRRHFFFVLTSTAACAVLAPVYTLWFHALGHSVRAAVTWGLAGVFCTPNWFYGTSTFDDILGASALVLAVGLAYLTRRRYTLSGALLAGLALGWTFNCKQPLGIYVVCVLAAAYNPTLALRKQVAKPALILTGLGLGVAASIGYDLFKFPPGTKESHADVFLLRNYPPVWPGNPLAALAGLSLSPGAGAFFYCPTLLLSFYGLATWYRGEPWFCRSVCAASGVFLSFLCVMTIFKGDPAWGPRYLTPVFALFWIFVPAGAAHLPRWLVGLLLAAGLAVQLLALSVDVHRWYIQCGVSYSHFLDRPWIYFQPAGAHLMNRPREIVELLTSGGRAERFTPSPSPTFAFPAIDWVEGGPGVVQKYHVLNSFRPWWISHWYLPPEQRPVDLVRTAFLLALTAGTGLLGMVGVLKNLETPGR